MPDRINDLLKFLEEEPDDAFTLYALALEYQKSNAQQAKETFRKLIVEHPDYLPTYYAAAHFFMKAGNREQVDDLFQRGIALAKIQNNKKAIMELQSAYSMWQMEED